MHNFFSNQGDFKLLAREVLMQYLVSGSSWWEGEGHPSDYWSPNSAHPLITQDSMKSTIAQSDCSQNLITDWGTRDSCCSMGRAPMFRHIHTHPLQNQKKIAAWILLALDYQIPLTYWVYPNKGRRQNKTGKSWGEGNSRFHPLSAWPKLFVKIVTHFCFCYKMAK